MIFNLQVLRAVAAYMVFLHHFSIYLTPVLPGAKRVAMGAAGVDIFFVISGFIMVVTTMGRRVSPTSFLLNRVARIVPVYWLVTLIVSGIAYAGFQPIGVMEIRAEYVVQTLLFIPFSRGGFIEPVNSVGWTLNYEMFFYIIFAALLVARSERVRIIGLVGVLLLCALVGVTHPSGVAPHFYTMPIVTEFSFGALLGYGYRRTERRTVSVRFRALAYAAVATGLLIIVVTQIMTLQLGIRGELDGFARPLVWGTAGTLIVAGALIFERAGLVFRSPWLIEQGNASYSIYLIHSLVLHGASKVAGRFAPPGVAGVVVILGLALPVTVVFGLLLFRFVELPANRGLRALFRRFGALSERPHVNSIPGTALSGSTPGLGRDGQRVERSP